MNQNPNQPAGPDLPENENLWQRAEPPVPPAPDAQAPQPAPEREPSQPLAGEPQPLPQTPYQTPVRASDEDRPIYHDQAHQTPEAAPSPFAPGSEGYHTYQQWQAQESKRRAKKERGPRSKKPFLIAGGLVAAVALFCGGLLLGTAQNGGGDNSPAVSANSNLPTLTISSTPSDGETGSTPSTGEMAGEDIYKKLNDSIVAIQSANANGQTVSSGSGVVMSADGYIITNAHVISDEDTGATLSNISVLFSDGTQLAATVVGSDEQSDLAVLKVEPESALSPAEFGDSDQLQVGEDAYAIGSPGGVQLANSMTSGIISAINRDITVNDRVMSLIQTNVTINPGNSGGALINKYGQVVGITSAKLGISYYEGLGFAIPINSAKEIIDELIQNGYISGRPSIGITGQNVSQELQQFYSLPAGVQVISVDSRSKAASEGLQAGDVITAVNGQSITSMDEINALKEDMKAGDKLKLTVYRPSQRKSMDLTITLTDAHDLEGTDPAQQQEQQQDNSRYYSGGYMDPFQYFFGY